MRRVKILWVGEYDGRKLEEIPTTVFGGFAPWRVEEFLKLARQHPEYYIAPCIEPELYVNSFVPNAQTYFLAEGDADHKFINDPHRRLGMYPLYSLNSDRNKHIA